MVETETPAQSRTWLPLAAAAAVAVSVVGAIVLANLGGRGDGFSLAGSATIPSGHAADAVVHDGDVVRGSGEVLAVRGRPVRFCAPVVTAGGTDGPGDCPVSVRVTGVDLGALSGRHQRGTAVTGAATLTGTYRAGTIAVSDQEPYHRAPVDPYDQPPCGEPDGGWPSGELDPDAAASYQSRHPDTVEIAAIMRPAKDETVMYVVTDGDPTSAGTALSPIYGKRLCAVRGKYTAGQISTARTMLDRHVGRGLTTPDAAGGPAIDHYGHLMVTADVPMLDDGFAADVDAQPAGLVQLTVWLRPTAK